MRRLVASQPHGDDAADEEVRAGQGERMKGCEGVR